MNHLTITIISLLAVTVSSGAEAVPENFRTENLIAWCIVPFDAAKRGPAERANMIRDLGMRSIAYDWRKEHIPTFRSELQAYSDAEVEMFAFWSGHENAYPLFREFGIQPQVWKTLRSPEEATQEGKIDRAVADLKSLAKQLNDEGLALGLYNHGGWGGEPANLVAVCLELRKRGYERVGIVYNFHHAHHRIETWAEDLALLKPYLLCLNLNGMVDDGPDKGMKILGIGEGDREKDMIQEVIRSGYTGPIGILDHQNETDSAETLRQNLDGLANILANLSAAR